jgi:hypothetical protein
MDVGSRQMVGPGGLGEVGVQDVSRNRGEHRRGVGPEDGEGHRAGIAPKKDQFCQVLLRCCIR